MPKKRHIDIRILEAEDKLDALKNEKAIRTLQEKSRARRSRNSRRRTRR